MNNILYTLFQDNPSLPGEICRFCKTLPQRCQAEQELYDMIQRTEQQLGRRFGLELEAAMTNYLAHEVRAYYLFGLGLRQELIREMMEADG